MNTDRLSQRLEAVANYIPKGYRLADIGSDHAYLPCYAVKNGMVPSAIAGEVVEGPYQSAKGQVAEEGLTDVIAVRKGDGLEVLSVGEVDVVTIAGMGGALIASILENGKTKLEKVQRLILQPNISAISIRTWLRNNGWELIAENMVEEDEKIYEILVAERGEVDKPYGNLQEGLLLGPFLMKEQPAPFKKKWQREMTNWKRILTQIEKAEKNAENVKKIEELQQKIRLVEGVVK
ncbi:tRNA (adenine22-N1)-methyltransferase [Cytobacillus horneckiae]|uniref:tRNA (Adenine-N(1))-methyltransferase n=1 Tax=Cytobacillus horneckiae TaxID=549687 RepID=A0A2N0ZHE7_9BACI|nr:tRNA (adenine(22)-N(1))-methyltransferase TrmK [Cytobacillus horneckiae]MBN6888898.1 tRNA (adenine-N(1))-methyltransferase [Cytobacillus horneckiae]MEC1155310.1 tRNA (adenine(22)-N(1))-methyltransferase TrmK [Cytobacillus horneckiae]MED2936637.1 tRNA (adenine(22)-N(1))-methyltransferase TrmK [Cytobacillus horneckiae]PKG28927.1 tRNA (adenine-N(1))-methyltransferase [Cytobacillus horneckiae]